MPTCPRCGFFNASGTCYVRGCVASPPPPGSITLTPPTDPPFPRPAIPPTEPPSDLSTLFTELYTRLDVGVSHLTDEGARAGHPVTCSTCTSAAACCRQLTTTSIPEAYVVAEALLRRPDWRDALPRLRTAAFADSAAPLTRRARFLADVPCGLLDPDARRCAVYDARPSCCRFHAVVWELAALVAREVGDAPYIQAPVSLAVLGLLACRPFESAEDAALVKHAARGLPTPEEWMLMHVPSLHAEDRGDENTRAIEEQLYAIGRRVFGGTP